jgi:hypothetical protein
MTTTVAATLVHGLTLLLAEGLVGPKKKSAALADSLVQGMLGGLAAELPILPPGTWSGLRPLGRSSLYRR